MSYILEALKRAEKERKLGQAPAALDEIAIPQAGESPSRRHGLLIGACGILVVAAAVYGAIKLFGGSRPATPQVAAAQAAITSVAPDQVAPTVESVAVAPPVATQPPATEAVTEPAETSGAADAKIEGGDAIASLDDLTGDTGNGQQADNGSVSDPEANLPPSGPAVELGASQTARVEEPAAATQPPPLSPNAATKPTIVRPEIPPAPTTKAARTPAAKARTATPKTQQASTAVVTPAAATSGRNGSHAPQPGPIIVLGDHPEVIEPASKADAVASPASIPATTPEISAAQSPAPETAQPQVPVVEPSASAPAAAAEVSTEPPAPAPARSAAPPPAAARAPAARADRTPAPSAAAAETRNRNDRLDSLRRFKEMPPAYRAEFPPLTVDVHVYNADSQRSFVIINGKRYRDGDTLAEGPRIAEIVSEGIVFEWRNEKVLYALGR